MKKLSFLIMIVLLLTLFSVKAMAIRTSGTCGEGISWVYDEATTTLTISGTGAIETRDHYDWSDARKYTTHIVIEEGITEIPHAAFSAFAEVQTVQIPASLRVIGVYAFSGCFKLTDISLHDDITEIKNYAFRETAIKSLTIPKGVTEISHGAFSGCRSLSEIALHDGVTRICDYAFDSCYALESIVIPDSVKGIGGSAFCSCIRLKSVDLGCGVEEIGNHAFGSCDSLVTINIPDSVTTIISYAFSDCENLEDVNIGAGASSIDTSAFDGCPKVTAFTISEANPNLCTDEKGVIYTKDKKNLILFPYGFSGDYEIAPGTISIAKYAAYECTGLTKLTIPGSIKVVDDYSFCGCKKLEKITLSEGIEEIKQTSFSRTAIADITIPKSVKKIDGLAFSGCKELKQITFLGSAPEIDSSAFSGVGATAYYPKNETSWTDYYWDTYINYWTDKLHLYGGRLTWVPYGTDTQPYAPSQPMPTEPKPTEPKPTEPKPTEPKPTEPVPTEPAPTEPKPTEPAVTTPPEIAPDVTCPVTEPQETQPQSTEGTEPTVAPTEPAVQVTEPESKTPWAAIVIAGVLSLAGGAAAVWVFVIKKRK